MIQLLQELDYYWIIMRIQLKVQWLNKTLAEHRDLFHPFRLHQWAIAILGGE